MSEEVQTPSADPAVEGEALKQGWVPLDEWRHAPEEWVDAETYVKRGREINPILRKTLKKKDEEIAALSKQLTDLKGTVGELAEHRDKIEQAAYDRALRDLKAQKKAAMADGDFERASDVDDAIDQLRDAKPEPKAKPKDPPKEDGAPTLHPAVQDFLAENKKWYNDKPENEEVVDYMNAVSARILRQHPGSDPSSVLDQAKEKTMAAFPDRFGSKPALYDGGSEGGGGRPSGKGYASLPAEGKAQFERFFASGYYKNMKKEDAQKAYFEQVEKYSA